MRRDLCLGGRSLSFTQPDFSNMTASTFVALQQQISSASFMLELSIPSSLTLLAALFITCNHNNLSSLGRNNSCHTKPSYFRSLIRVVFT